MEQPEKTRPVIVSIAMVKGRWMVRVLLANSSRAVEIDTSPRSFALLEAAGVPVIPA